MKVEFDIDTEVGCDKVLRSGFQKWSTITNPALQELKCQHLQQNFESLEQAAMQFEMGPPDCNRRVLGMALNVKFNEEGELSSIQNCDDKGSYISYTAVDLGLANLNDEVIPLVINDRHAFRCKERGLWRLFYSDGKLPLDYLSERMSAIIR